MCDVAHAVMFDHFEETVRNRALVEGGVPVDDLRARFDGWLVSEAEPGRHVSIEQLEYERALGVA